MERAVTSNDPIVTVIIANQKKFAYEIASKFALSELYLIRGGTIEESVREGRRGTILVTLVTKTRHVNTQRQQTHLCTLSVT